MTIDLPRMREKTAKSRTLKALNQSVFFVSFPFGILAFVLPIYGKELGATALEIGGFFSAASIVPVIVRPFLGRALDRWGRKPFLLLGLSGYVVAIVLFSLSNSVILLTAARFVQGLGIAFLWLSAYTIVADCAEESGRGQDFGIIDEATNRGAILGTMAGFLVLFALQSTGLDESRVWFWIFAGYSVPAVLSLWSGWRGVQETRPETSPSIAESRPLSGQLLALMGIVFVTGASTAMVWPLLMVFLQDNLNAAVGELAFAYLPAALLSSFLPSRLGRTADVFGRKKPMVVGLVIGAMASALMPQLRTLTALTILWAIESVGYITMAPAERAFVADIAGEDVRGTNYGLYTFALFLGAVIGPLIGGWLYDNVGHATPFYLNTVVLILGAILVASVLRESRPKASPENKS